MTKQEFEQMVGKEVADATFKAFEAAYMASDLDKVAFCATVKKAVPAKKPYIIGIDYTADGKGVYSWTIYEAKKDGFESVGTWYDREDAEKALGIDLYEYRRVERWSFEAEALAR